MTKPVTGWAVVDDDKIDVRTVCETRRAALVNWLVVNKRIFISTLDTDEQIERWWFNHCGDTAICTTVTVTMTPR